KCRRVAVGEAVGGLADGLRCVDGHGARRPRNDVGGGREEPLDVAPMIDMVVREGDCVYFIKRQVALGFGKRPPARVHPHLRAIPLDEVTATSLVPTGIAARAAENRDRQSHSIDPTCSSSGPSRRRPSSRNRSTSPEEMNVWAPLPADRRTSPV